MPQTSALDKGLAKGILEYSKAAAEGITDGPYLIATGVQESVYDAWAEKQEGCWRVGFVCDGDEGDLLGSVYLFGDPSVVHERLAAKICGEFWLQLGRVYEEPDQILETIGSTRYKIRLFGGNYIYKEPDGGFVPSSMDKSFPTLVYEIAYKNETYTSLKNQVKWWATGGATVSLGVKVTFREGEIDLKVVIVNHEKGIEHFCEIDFGTDVVKGLNQEVVKIPLRWLTRGTTPPGLESFEFTLDLYKLQEWVKKANLEEVPDVGT